MEIHFKRHEKLKEKGNRVTNKGNCALQFFVIADILFECRPGVKRECQSDGLKQKKGLQRCELCFTYFLAI